MRIKLFIIIIIVSVWINSDKTYAQTSPLDLHLLSEVSFHNGLAFYDTSSGNSSTAIDLSKRGILTKINPVSWVMVSMMYGYQNVLTHQLSSGCGFELSCSNFSKACISEFGLVKGLALSADRLLRCTKGNITSVSSIYFNEQGKIIDPPTRYRFED